MKSVLKIIVLIMLAIFTINQVSAYEVTSEDEIVIKKLQKVTDRSNKRNLIKNKESIQKLIDKNVSERTTYLMIELNKYIDIRLEQITQDEIEQQKLLEEEKIRQEEELKKQEEEKIKKEQEEKEKENKTLNFRKELVKNYYQGLSDKKEMYQNCYTYDWLADEMGKKNNFPTELIVATWRIESWCNPNNPKSNSWWLFQITSKSWKPWYKAWKYLNNDEIRSQIQDYIDVTNWKINYYNSHPRYNHKKITLSYDNYTINDIKARAWIYNWIISESSLNSKYYVMWNFTYNNKSSTNWVLNYMIKYLNKKTENQ